MTRAQRLFLSPKFPGYAWAWPKGNRERLLQAATLSDLDRAVAVLREWEKLRTFEDLTFPEQRLLVAISVRMPANKITLDERARLTGIERKLWTASRMTMHGSQEAATLMAGAGIDMLVMKGAARSALDLQNLKGRAAYDIDILVKPEDYRRAIELLIADGWKSNHDLLVRRYLDGSSGMAAVNMHKGQHGDVDLHQYAFYHVAGANDRGLWARSREVDFLGQKLRVASPEDNLAIAIAHGGVGGHGQSDWMVDCVNIIRESTIDWALFEEICRDHGIMSFAAITLTFLRERLETPIPDEALLRIARAGRRPGWRLWSSLYQAYPKRQHNWIGVVGRGVSRISRQSRAVAFSQKYARAVPTEPPARSG